MQFIMGLKLKRKADRIVRGRQDALTAALKVKTEHPESIGGATHVTHHMRSPVEEQIRQDRVTTRTSLHEQDGGRFACITSCQPQARPSAAIGGSR
jgi:hypothetical protein